MPYKDFVVPAVLVQTMTFAAMGSGVGIANDMQTGMVDRFRSLPMARSAVLVGRTLADLLRNCFVVALMCGVGVLVGWSPDASFLSVLAGVGLILAFAYGAIARHSMGQRTVRTRSHDGAESALVSAQVTHRALDLPRDLLFGHAGLNASADQVERLVRDGDGTAQDA